jgi:sugar phosphate permease
LANVLCGFLLVHAGWRAAFLGPALLLGLMAATLWFGLPERASVLGAPAGATASAALVAADRAGVGVAQATAEVLEHTRATPFRSPLLWCYGASYFFIKFIRYALLFWLPYYLSTILLYRADLAASVASAFEVGGIVGVIAIGVLSDRVRVLSRGALSALSLIGLAIALFAYTSLARHGIWLNAVGLACIGALLFGPDALLSGAAAQDAGGVRAAATATGMVNGLGSVGAIVESFVVPHVSGRYGWSALFPMLVLLALGAAGALGPSVLRGRRPVMG